MSIEVSNLRVTYGAAAAVDGISFKIAPGEVCGYLGPNGAGKSSTVRVLVGVQEAAAGSVSVAGFELPAQKLEAQRRLGYVPENAAAYPLLTGREYLDLVTELYELDRDVAATRRKVLIDNFDLAEPVTRPIATFSKGQRQKLVLASALLHEPEVLVLDEPLTGLDANAARSVKELIQGLAAAGCAVLFCSHNLDMVERLCRRVIVLDKGRIVADAPVSELVALSKDKTLEATFAQLTIGSRESGSAEVVAALRPAGGSGAAPVTAGRGKQR